MHHENELDATVRRKERRPRAAHGEEDQCGERQNLGFEQRPEVEPLGMAEIGEAEENPVGDEITGKIGLENCS